MGRKLRETVGRHSIRRIIFVLGIIVGTLMFAGGSTPAEAGLDSDCGLTITPNPSVPGTETTIEGTGWGAGSRVLFFQGAQGFDLVQADSNGEFRFSRTWADVGTMQLQAFGASAQPAGEFGVSNICAAEITVRVDPAAAQLNPDGAPVPGVMTFHAGCFLIVNPGTTTVEGSRSVFAGGFEGSSPILVSIGEFVTRQVIAEDVGSYGTTMGLPIVGTHRIQLIGSRKGGQGFCFPSVEVTTTPTPTNPGWDWGKHEGCTIAVVPRSGPTGRGIEVAGFGFEPATSVQLILHGDPSTQGIANESEGFFAAAVTQWPVGHREVKLAGTSALNGRACFPRAFFETVPGELDDLSSVPSFIDFLSFDQEASLLPGFFVDADLAGVLTLSGSTVDLGSLPTLLGMTPTLIDLDTFPADFVFTAGDLEPAPIVTSPSTGAIEGPGSGPGAEPDTEAAGDPPTGADATAEDGADDPPSEQEPTAAGTTPEAVQESGMNVLLLALTALGAAGVGFLSSRLLSRRRSTT